MINIYKGKGVDLYRALVKSGNTIDFYLSSTRNINASKSFLSKAIQSITKCCHPVSINTDKNPAYIGAIRQLQEEGRRPPDLKH